MAEREPHIDVLRSIAILCMVEVHIAATVKPADVSATDPLGLFAAAIGGLAAPLFVTISGWGSRRAVARREDWQRQEILRWVGVRFGFLMLAQLVVNLIASHIFNWYTPGILTLLALCTLLALPLARLGAHSLSGLLAILVLTPFALTSLFAMEGGWSSVITASNPVEWLGLLLIDGTYPVLPWLAFFVLGGIIHDAQDRAVRMLLGASACFSALALFIAIFGNRHWALTNGDAVLTFFPANSAFLVSAICGVLAGVVLLGNYRRWSFSGPISIGFQLSGRISLTIYLLHFIPLRIIAGMGLEPLSTGLALTIVFGYSLIWWPLAILHNRYAEGLSLEALLSRLSTPIARR